MNTKNIKDLLNIMLMNQEYFGFGLCQWALAMYCHNYFTKDEYYKLKKYISENRPGLFESKKAFISYIRLDAFYWKQGDIAPRIKWIKKHIKLND